MIINLISKKRNYTNKKKEYCDYLHIHKHKMSAYQIEDLSIDLLEKDPDLYFLVLESLENNGFGDLLKVKLNEKLYRGWYGNHVFCLYRLVGSLAEENHVDDMGMSLPPDSFYGGRYPEGISEELGITILDKMVSLGVNIHDTDYYDNKIIDCSSEGTLTYRTGNDHFREKVREYFNRT
tara:strand:+ start:231 stop:767 length:537 start_codon:yes stop_codon:yes gene_type:complete